MDYITVRKDSEVSFTEKKSEFIGYAFFVSSEEDVQRHLEEVRTAHPEATHHVYAYSLRTNGIQKMSDDGEPQGTAGMPVLQVIKFHKLTDVCLIVVRYFGGILLGAGGLVRAYTKAAAMAVEASGETPILLFSTCRIRYTYDLHNNVLRLLSAAEARIVGQEFGEQVTVDWVLPEDRVPALRDQLHALSYQIEFEQRAQEYNRLQ